MPKWKSSEQRAKRLDAERLCSEVSRKLYEARLDRGIPMQAVADALGRTRQQIEDWESGRTSFTLPVLLEWALSLDLKIALYPKQDVPFAHVDAPLDARFLQAFRTADPRSRDAIAVLLGIDKAPRPPIELRLPRGRPAGVKTATVVRLSPDQLEQLRKGPMPPTGNKLLTAITLTNTRIARVASATGTSYSRLASLVHGQVKSVALAYAEELASCFGCAAQDLFPHNLTIAGVLSNTSPGRLETIQREESPRSAAAIEDDFRSLPPPKGAGVTPSSSPAPQIVRKPDPVQRNRTTTSRTQA